MSPPEGLITREGVIEDYEGVMELQRNVGFSGGTDFVPGLYRYWLHSKLYQVHIAEHKGKIVGIFVSFRAPGSTHIASLAARIHTDYRRTGTKDALYTSGGVHIEKKHPDFTQANFDALRSKFWEKALREKENVLTVSRKWAIYFYLRPQRHEIERLISNYPSGKLVTRLNPEQITSLNEDIQERIKLEGDYFTPHHGWLSLPVNKDTVKYSSTVGEVHVSYKEKEEDKGAQLMGVSFGSVFTIDRAARMDFAYFGEGDEHFYRHLSSHLKHTLTVYKNNAICIVIRQPLIIDKYRVEKVLSSYLGRKEKLSDIEDIPTAYLFSHPRETSKL